MLCAVLLASFTPADLVPPFLRTNTVAIGGYGGATLLDGDTFYAVDNDTLYKVNLKSQKRATVFKAETNAWIRDFDLRDSQIYAVVYSRKSSKATLAIIDPITGKPTASTPLDSDAQSIAFSPGQYFASVKRGTISGVDLKTRKTRWTLNLTKFDPQNESFRQTPESLTYSGGVLLGTIDSTAFAIDANKGTLLWTQPNCYFTDRKIPVTGSMAMVMFGSGMIVHDLRSGKAIWQNDLIGPATGYGYWGADFYCLDDGKITLFDTKSGQIKWQHQTDSEEHVPGIAYATVLNDTLYYQGRPNAGILKKDGTHLWKGRSEDNIPEPIWQGGKTIATWDGTNVSFYESGTKLTVPETSAERQALAKKLCGAFGSLSSGELDVLIQLGGDAVPALLDLIINPPDTFGVWPRDIYEVLDQVVTQKQTDLLIGTLKKLTQSEPEFANIAQILAAKGNPDITTSFFLDSLVGKNTGIKLTKEGFEAFSAIATTIESPRAVSYAIHILDDPEAETSVRFAAYLSLPTTGGEAGRSAVLRHRAKRTLLRPIETRLNLAKLEPAEEFSGYGILKTAKATNGKTYALFMSPILGGYKDLWIAEQKDGKWVRPLFVGIAEPPINYLDKSKTPKPLLFQGKTAKQLIDGEWIKLLPENPTLTLDIDQDGLTDLMETRLGTDPKKADTDGDGDSDEIDPWPTTARQIPSTPETEIFSAVWDCTMWSEASYLPMIFPFPSGVDPFELPGWYGPAFPTTHTLTGVSDPFFYRFLFGGLSSSDKRDDLPYHLEIAPDGVTATCLFGFSRNRFSAGSRYTLKKIDGTWFVTSVKSAWIT